LSISVKQSKHLSIHAGFEDELIQLEAVALVYGRYKVAEREALLLSGLQVMLGGEREELVHLVHSCLYFEE